MAKIIGMFRTLSYPRTGEALMDPRDDGRRKFEARKDELCGDHRITDAFATVIAAEDGASFSNPSQSVREALVLFKNHVDCRNGEKLDVVQWLQFADRYAQAARAEQPSQTRAADARALIAIRDALVERDMDEAYHQLYQLADRGRGTLTPWDEWEATAVSVEDRPADNCHVIGCAGGANCPFHKLGAPEPQLQPAPPKRKWLSGLGCWSTGEKE